MNRFITLLLFTFLICTFSYSQVSFTAEAERTTVAIGEQAVIVATLIANKNLGALAPPQAASTDAFAVINSVRQGPSSFSSIEIVNGVTKQRNEVHYQFVYTISPKKSGSFSFPALTVSVDGTEYNTNAIPFNATNEVVKNTDIKIQLQLNRHSLYIGEQAGLVFKVFQRVHSPINIQNGFSTPLLSRIEKSFSNNFSIDRLFTNEVTRSEERIDGEMYVAFSIGFSISPLNSGSFTISSIPFEYYELKKVQRRKADPFMDDFFGDAFFGGGEQAIPKSALSNQITINVKPLPAAPAGFTGSVGKFTINASIEPQEVPAGEAATIKITVKGNSRPTSMGEITLPKIDNCEVFTPEKQTVTDTTPSGFTTRKIYKYMIVPHEKGTVSISPISFPYFDPEAGSYKTASSEQLSLNVIEGKEGIKKPTRYLSQEEIQQIGQDIRFIKTDVKIKSQSEAPYKEPVFFLLMPIPFILFLLAVLYKFQASQKQKNSGLYTRQKALANATRQLRQMQKQHTQLSQSVFLGKISQIIETYISNKFDFAATGRTLEEVKEELLRLNVDEKVVTDLAQFIQHLDSYRFGGLSFNESSRSSTLEKTNTFLESLEKGIRKDK